MDSMTSHLFDNTHINRAFAGGTNKFNNISKNNFLKKIAQTFVLLNLFFIFVPNFY